MGVRERVDAGAENRTERALARGEWEAARDLLEEAGRRRGLSPLELDQLGRAAYGAGDLEGAITAWERLHAERVAAGAHVEAAGAAANVAMYLMMDTGLMSPVRGWTSRAERLLVDQEETPVHAVLAMVRTYERFMCGDLAHAASWAERAIEVGTRQRVPVAATLGRVAQARLRILDGHVDEGLALLEDAAVATVSGELDALAVGMVYCEVICAMQGLAQYDRAEQWTDAMERWRQGTAFGGFNGRCRVHRAEILRLRGSCEEAETEALHACDELRPWMRREYGWPLTELGTIRLRRGDLAGAQEALLAAHAHGWDPQPGLALLRLAQGDADEAAALIAGALDHPVAIPSKERPPQGGLRRAPLLEARTEIALATDDVPTAAAAARELTEIAEVFSSRALAAAASLARGRVALATGEIDTAIHETEAAVAAWCEVAAPYEAAVARTVLAEAHRSHGATQAARLELTAAAAAFEEMGARGRVDEVARARTALDSGARLPQPAPAPVTARPSATNVFRLDGDIRTIDFDGTTVRLRDLKGMRHLARLLAEPDREFHALDLVAGEEGIALAVGPTVTQEGPWSLGGDAGPVLDAQAKDAYRRRLADIAEDIDEALLLGDDERAALAQADRDYLLGELSRAVGLGGRSRRVGSTSERARATATRTIRYAMARISDHHPALGAHLEQTIRTGTYCSYGPDPRVPTGWRT